MARRRWNIESIKQVVDGENPIIQVGYSPKIKRHKKGQQWKDVKGITWEQRDGYTVRVNKQADSIRSLVKKICSDCKKDLSVFGDKLDDKIFAKTGKCFNCLEIEETVMRIQGKFKEYEKKKILQNQRSTLKEMQKHVIESIDFLKKEKSQMQMVCSNGEIVTWSGGDLSKILKMAEEDLIKINEGIDTLTKEIEKL